MRFLVLKKKKRKIAKQIKKRFMQPTKVGRFTDTEMKFYVEAGHDDNCILFVNYIRQII